MIKLLKAGFFRLKKDVIFWLFIFLTIGMAGFTLFRYTNTFGKIYLDKLVNEFMNVYDMTTFHNGINDKMETVSQEIMDNISQYLIKALK